MRLIDADKMTVIYDEDNNAVIFGNLETARVEAIPVEWIKKWSGNEPYWVNLAEHMLDDWEKENAREIKLVKKYPHIKDEDVTSIFQEGYIKGFENGSKGAIPIEWVKRYASKKSANDEMDCYWHFWEEDVLKMIGAWEKENEQTHSS